VRKCALDPEDPSFMNFKKASDAVVAYCDAAKALQKFLIMIKNFEDLSKLMGIQTVAHFMLNLIALQSHFMLNLILIIF